MCISGDPDRIPWPKPDGYDPEDFLLIQRGIEASDGKADFFTRMPPSSLPGYPGPKKKYCLCCGISIGATDQPTLNKGWASAGWERKQEIIADHTYFELGTFYYLANDRKVPEAVRKEFSAYGLCSDEFEQFGHVPPQLYIRISNRLVGDFVMTQNTILPRAKSDSIAVGDWSFDEHMTGKYAVPVDDQPGKYEVTLEGNFWPSIANGSNWYDVPYRIMLPKRGTGANLLVPVCLSVSAVAFSSVRIENMYMSVGTAAGVAAKQLVDGEVATVQDVDVPRLQALLGTFGQRVHGPPGKNPPPPSPPYASYYNVTGAGSSEWDGMYQAVAADGSKEGSGDPVYRSVSCSHCSLYTWDGTWRLAVQGVELYYVAAHKTGAWEGPPLAASEWEVANGTSPAPALAAGPIAGGARRGARRSNAV